MGDNIVKDELFFCFRVGGLIGNDENIFIIFFHHVFFPGKFFNGSGIIGKLGGLFLNIRNFLLIIELVFKQIFIFLSAAELKDQIVAVEEYHPGNKCQQGKQEFVFQKRGDMS